MKSLEISGLEIKAIASAVPENIEYNSTFEDIYKKDELDRICNMTGVSARRIAPEGMSSADLMYKATKRLLDNSRYGIKDIDCIICISQTPAYNTPGNSYVLCNMLGAENDIVALDINAGCPGFTHGLITMAKILDRSYMKNGLLVVGDTFTKLISDRKDRLLYGDGASACLVSLKEDSKAVFAQWKTAAKKYDKLISFAAYNQSGRGTFMDGQELFCFGMKEIPEMLAGALTKNEMKIEDIDLFLFHQSNKTLLEHVGDKLGIPRHKIPIYMEGIGSASGASIPITLCRYAQENNIRSFTGRICFTGFGAGLGISTIILDVKNMMLEHLCLN